MVHLIGQSVFHDPRVCVRVCVQLGLFGLLGQAQPVNVVLVLEVDDDVIIETNTSCALIGLNIRIQSASFLPH